MTASVRVLSAVEAHARVGELADVLLDCVESGASVSFMRPLSHAKAMAFWHGIADGVANGALILLVAEDEARIIVGTVQVVFAQAENQPHRGDVAKMLVHRRGRRQGLGAQLMLAAEQAAGAAGKTLLVLDTVTGGEGERLYRRAGWQEVGVVPDFALWPEGGLCATTFFYKRLACPPN